MRRIALATGMLLLVATSATAGGWHDLDGRKAPEISANQWLNVPDGTPSVESLEGKVWLLNFIGIH